jgi:hypothetical protein
MFLVSVSNPRNPAAVLPMACLQSLRGVVAIVGFSDVRWISKFMAYCRSLVVAASFEDLLVKVRGSGPSTIILPDLALKKNDLRSIRRHFPAARIIMIWRQHFSEKQTRAAIANMAEAHRLGGAMLGARGAIRKLLKLLGLRRVVQLTAGDVVHDYKLIRLINTGGFGSVWNVQNKNDASFSAMKIVYAGEDGDNRCFQTEYNAVRLYKQRAAGCPHLIQILHTGKDPFRRFFFYTMPLADPICGPFDPDSYEPTTLRKWRAISGRTPVEDSVRILLEILTGLDCLHRNGLVHADVKAVNILRLNGVWLFADVGLATRLCHTPSGGTPGYFPDEGQSGLPSDDTWACGKVLFELITGRSAPEFDNYLINTMLPYDPANPSVESVMAKACAPEREDRFPNAAEMKAALENVLQALLTKNK